MQIHELNTFSGTPGSTDYLAVDNGTETMKLPASFAESAVIVETGTNYVRFSNGVQICWINSTVSMAISNAYGSLYQGGYTWTFPKEFISAPAVSVGAVRWGTSAGWGTLGGAPSTTSVILRGIDTASRASGSTMVNAIAIGKWR